MDTWEMSFCFSVSHRHGVLCLWEILYDEDISWILVVTMIYKHHMLPLVWPSTRLDSTNLGNTPSDHTPTSGLDQVHIHLCLSPFAPATVDHGSYH